MSRDYPERRRLSEDELLEVPGVGKELAAKIAEYIKTEILQPTKS